MHQANGCQSMEWLLAQGSLGPCARCQNAHEGLCCSALSNSLMLEGPENLETFTRMC